MCAENTEKIEKFIDKEKTALVESLKKIPYLKQIVQGGELAKMAYDFVNENSPEYLKQEVGSAFNYQVMGRWAAFKNFLTVAWTGESNFQRVLADYEDFLSMYEDPANCEISFLEYFNATRAAGGTGDFKTYEQIMNKMSPDDGATMKADK